MNSNRVLGFASRVAQWVLVNLCVSVVSSVLTLGLKWLFSLPRSRRPHAEAIIWIHGYAATWPARG